MPHVTGLFIYPVKSCRGHSLTSAQVDAWGFADDRRYLVVSPEGEFFTQRTHPRMALIETGLAAAGLTLASPNHGDVTVPALPFDSNRARTVTIWKNTVVADDCGDDAAEWLTRFLGVPARLVKMGAHYERPVKPSKARPGDVVSFADAYPFLLLSHASLDQLNDRLVETGDEPVPMDRFRPNILVSGNGPFAEDTWTRLRIGDVYFRNAGPCVRCVVTTTDQQTAARGKEPLKTLATFRRDPANPTDINFGANLIHETKTGRVRLGDEVVPEAISPAGQRE